MMSKLTQRRDEVKRLLTVYQEHQHSDDPMLRRRAHVELDKFLMANRETAALLMAEGLDREIAAMRQEQLDNQSKQKGTYKVNLLARLFKLRKQQVTHHQ